MKTLFKILGIAVGIYGLFDIGVLVGIAGCDNNYNDRWDENNKLEKGAKDSIGTVIEMWNDLNKGHKSKKNRSEVLRAHARKWAKEGYSSEEIKQGLELLRKELD